MKFKAMSASIIVCALAVSLSGCGESKAPEPTKSDTPAPTPTVAAPAQPAAEVTPTPAEVKPAVETPAAPAAPAVEPAAAPAAPVEDTVTAQAQTLINKAKALVDAKQYQDALDVINQLGTLKLSTEQQKIVDDLKAQVQNLMSSQTVTNAANAVGNLLGK
jgi:hypothetical protein